MNTRSTLCPVLIDREPEIAAIDAALEAARGGHGGAIILLGEAGVGKSRVVDEAAAHAERQHVRVLRGHCAEGGAADPYRPLAEALLAGLRGHAPPDVPELRPYKPTLGRLIPDWRSDVPSAAESSVVLLGEAILRLLLVLAGDHGCLLILEDLHWADSETLAVLEYLGATVRTEPLLLVATLRSDEPSAAQSLAHAFRRGRTGQVLELARLGDHEIALMGAACLGTSALSRPISAALASSADGLPLLVEDLLAEWVAAGDLVMAGGEWQADRNLQQVVPVTFGETVHRRLLQLDEDARRILQLAALFGRSFDWRILPLAVNRDEERVLGLLQEAVQRQLISAEAAGEEHHFHFRHALTQAAVLAQLLPPQRARLSARLLDVVDQVHPGLPGDWCELAAQLAQEAGRLTLAAALRLESGRRALDRGALVTAEASLGQARSLVESGDLALEIDEALLELLALAGKHQQVAGLGEELIQALRRTVAAGDRLGRAHLRIARAMAAASDWTSASQHVDAARELAASGGAPLSASIGAVAAHVAIGQGQIADAHDLARCALEAAEDAGLWGIACEALEVIGRAARARNSLDGAEAAFDRARVLAEEHDLAIWRLRAMHELGTIDIFTPGAGPERLREARRLAEEAGAVGLAAIIDVQLAAMHVASGEFKSVLEIASRSAETARRLGLNATRAVALLFVAEAYGRNGPDRSAMEAALSEAILVSRGDKQLRAEVERCAWGDARAFASLVEENRVRALDEARTAQGSLRGVRSGAPSPSRGLWALLETLDGVDGERACKEVRSSAAIIHPFNQAYLQYAQAVAAGREGRQQEAEHAVTAGDKLLAGSSPWGLHVGHRLIADEAIAHDWGSPAKWLTEAASFLDEHGQGRVAAACRSLLRKTGARIPRAGRAHPRVPPSLRARRVTDREMEVLGLVAEGLSNRAIGDRLYLSPKTVEKHISSLMNKLDVRSRAQLTAIAVSGSSSPRDAHSTAPNHRPSSGG
jgi:DNA-binding CsgD family transcriptional regulator